MGITFINPLRYADETEFINGGEWPTDGETGGIPHSRVRPHYIDSIMLSHLDGSNRFTITYNHPALGNDNTLVFYTATDGGVKNWHCDQGSIVEVFRPEACKKEE